MTESVSNQDKHAAIPKSCFGIRLTHRHALDEIEEFFKEKFDLYVLHGIFHGEKGRGAWMLSDGRPLTFDMIMDKWEESHEPGAAQNLCIVADSCFSGAWANHAARRNHPKVFVQAACGLEVVTDDLPASSFTRYWVQKQQLHLGVLDGDAEKEAKAEAEATVQYWEEKQEDGTSLLELIGPCYWPADGNKWLAIGEPVDSDIQFTQVRKVECKLTRSSQEFFDDRMAQIARDMPANKNQIPICTLPKCFPNTCTPDLRYYPNQSSTRDLQTVFAISELFTAGAKLPSLQVVEADDFKTEREMRQSIPHALASAIAQPDGFLHRDILFSQEEVALPKMFQRGHEPAYPALEFILLGVYIYRAELLYSWYSPEKVKPFWPQESTLKQLRTCAEEFRKRREMLASMYSFDEAIVHWPFNSESFWSLLSLSNGRFRRNFGVTGTCRSSADVIATTLWDWY